MIIVLTILSVIALWTFLTVLVFGLLVIIKPLQGVRMAMEKIAMGVRAIEKQTEPLGGYAEDLAAGLTEAAAALRGIPHA